jgi:hypothetical protein
MELGVLQIFTKACSKPGTVDSLYPYSEKLRTNVFLFILCDMLRFCKSRPRHMFTIDLVR